MTTDQLIASAQALLDLDAEGALTRGIGGHARSIIEGFLALSAPPAAGVKGLEWRSLQTPFCAEARLLGSAARYLQDFVSSKYRLWTPSQSEWRDDPAEFDTMEELQAAAQADFDQRIRSALVASPERRFNAALDGGRPLPFDRDEGGRMVRETWVRWAQTQPTPKSSWLAPYDALSEEDKEADRQIAETIGRWTLLLDAAARSIDAAEAASTIERLSAIEQERDRLRTALIDAGRAAGGGVADTVSTDFLMHVPAQVTARLGRTEQERDALREALKPLAALNLPKGRHIGTAGFYSIRFEEIQVAKAALDQTRTDASEAPDGH